MTYRNLTEDEVLRLKSQSCLADDWGKVNSEWNTPKRTSPEKRV